MKPEIPLPIAKVASIVFFFNGITKQHKTKKGISHPAHPPMLFDLSEWLNVSQKHYKVSTFLLKSPMTLMPVHTHWSLKQNLVKRASESFPPFLSVYTQPLILHTIMWTIPAKLRVPDLFTQLISDSSRSVRKKTCTHTGPLAIRLGNWKKGRIPLRLNPQSYTISIKILSILNPSSLLEKEIVCGYSELLKTYYEIITVSYYCELSSTSTFPLTSVNPRHPACSVSPEALCTFKVIPRLTWAFYAACWVSCRCHYQ